MVFYFLRQDIERQTENGYFVKGVGFIKSSEVKLVKDKLIPLARQFKDTEGLRECKTLEFVGLDLHHIPPKIDNRVKAEVLDELLDTK